MKNHIRIALISLSMGAAAQAAPFMAIGDSAELFLTGTLGVRVDDNIFLTKNGEDDVIFDINPGVELTFGKNAQLTGSLRLVHSFANYADNSDLNTNLFGGDFVSKYDDAKLKLGLSAGFHELNQNTFSTRGLTRRDVFSAGANAEVEISQITSVAAGLQFSHENYKPAGYTDSDSLTVPLDLYYRWTPKVDLSVGYRYRDYQVDALGQDSSDHYFNVGARGEFTPKLIGRFTVGLNNRKIDQGGDESQLGLDASFTYEFSPKTNLQVGASNDFGTSPQGQQQRNFTLNGLITTKISEEWSVNLGLSYRGIEYDAVPAAAIVGRTDDYLEGTIGTSYIVNANIRILGTYVYRNYSSDITASEFKNNVFSIAANFRY
jgi:polysaccharide biosynthesis protein VpsM